MTYNLDDTIAAIASASGGGARGIVRISGPATLSIVEAAFEVDDEHSLNSKKRPSAATGTVNLWFDDAARRGMPGDLYFWPTERSYTRQPVAEFHMLGSPPLLQALLDQVCRSGARLAEPGEFTLRAFLAGRLDLTQAEAVLGVIDAEHQNQLASALAQLAGGLARPLHQLRDDLLQLLAELEAGLDFADEDIEFVTADEIMSRLQAAGQRLEAVNAQMVGRTIAHSTPQVVLVGRPNAGKSSLFNALVAHCQSLSPTPLRTRPAIVSEQQGTTRDYLTSIVGTGGFQFELVDTAGTPSRANLLSQLTRRANELVEATPDSHAQKVTAVRQQQAVARVLCIDVSLDRDETEIRSDLTESVENQSISIVALTKSDLASRRAESLANLVAYVPAVVTSSVAGRGLSELLRVIARQLANVESRNVSGCVAATADRCRDSLRLATAAIGHAMEANRAHAGDELVAAELRAALADLGKVVGAVYTDDLLDRIFGSFCIGK